MAPHASAQFSLPNTTRDPQPEPPATEREIPSEPERESQPPRTPPPAPGTPGDSRDSISEREMIAQHIRRLADGELTVDERQTLLDELLATGQPGAYSLCSFMSRNATDLPEAYAQAFARSASDYLQDRWPDDAAQQIQDARARINSMWDDGEVQKDEVVRVGDPAMAVLRGLFSLDVDEVLRHDDALATQRAKLIQTATVWREAYDMLDERDQRRHREPWNPEQADGMIATAEALGVLGALPIDNRSANVFLQNESLFAQHNIPDRDREAMRAYNHWRFQIGRAVVEFDPKLWQACVNHSTDMEEHDFFSHESPVSGRTSPWDRARECGTTAHAENIAAGYPTPTDAVLNGWWHSPGHLNNMIGEHKRFAVGSYERQYTQLFGG